MLVAILIGGAVLAVALGLNPLTFQKFAPAAQSTPIAIATAVGAPATAVVTGVPAIGATAVPPAARTAVPTVPPTPGTGVAPVAVQTPQPVATAVAAPVESTRVQATQVLIAPTAATTPGATSAVRSARHNPPPDSSESPRQSRPSQRQGIGAWPSPGEWKTR